MRKRRPLSWLAAALLCAAPVFARQVPPGKAVPMIAHTVRSAAWPDKQEGYTTVPLPTGAGNESTAPGDWFARPEISVHGVPFRVAPAPVRVFSTTRAGEETLAVPLHGRASEVLLLVDADFPPTEMLGIDTNQPTNLDVLDEPERCVVEVEDASGQVSGTIPLDAATGTYGVRRGLRLYAVRTNDLGDLRALRFHDRMTNAVFSLVGVTLRAGTPLIAEPASRSVQYPPVKKSALASCELAFDTARGLAWSRIVSPMFGQNINLAGHPVFTLRLGDTAVPSTAWLVKNVRASPADTVVTLTYQSLRAVFSAHKSRQSETVLDLKLFNDGPNAVQGSLTFPEIGPVALGAPADTWYFTSAYGGIFHHAPADYKTFTRGEHPLSLDGVFSPASGAGLAFLPRDENGVFRWYHLSKNERGCRYALEYLPETVGKGERWTTLPVAVAAVPGDWKDQLAYYRRWAATWYKPAAPRKTWFERVFAFDTHHPYAGDANADAAFGRAIRQRKAEVGASDFLHLFAWAMTDSFGHWGEYSHFFQYSSADPAAPLAERETDGKRRFARSVRETQAAGTPMGLYLDSNLYSTKAEATLTPEQIEAWAQRNAKGDKVSNYENSVSMFLQAQGWRDYLAGRYAALARDIGPRGFYIDELGGSLPEHVHYVNRHGLTTPVPPTRGERETLQQVRAALPPGTALYTEFYPPDTFLPFTDGAFSYPVMMRYKGREAFWTPPRDRETSSDVVAPHYLNLMRFAFPDVKTFHIVYSTPHENGNWFLLRYPFFNGDGQYLKAETRGHIDPAARAFYRKTFALQHAHADAFTSPDVEPLVPTQHPDLYANRFGTPNKTVWTLFNAGYHTLRGPLLVVAHRPGARYVDAWTGQPVAAKIRGRRVELSFAIGPRSVGCLVQERPQ